MTFRGAAPALPEAREGEAPPEAEAIYAGLRDAMGVPIVNLIWRHFATLPGVLPWAWETTRRVIGSATVVEGGARMAALVGEAPGPGLPGVGAAFRALPPDDRARVADTVRVYNRGNRVNLQVLSAVRLLVSGDAPRAGEAPRRDRIGPLAPVAASLPPLPRTGDLPETVRAELSAFGELHDPAEPVVPSLYRHLALWPSLLPPLREALAPLFAAGRIASLRGALLDVAEGSAAALLPRLAPPGPFPAAHREHVLRVLAVFPGKLIAEMAAIGLLLDGELSRAGEAWESPRIGGGAGGGTGTAGSAA